MVKKKEKKKKKKDKKKKEKKKKDKKKEKKEKKQEIVGPAKVQGFDFFFSKLPATLEVNFRRTSDGSPTDVLRMSDGRPTHV